MRSYGIWLLPALCLAAGCNTLYFGTMEKFGIHKRDLFVERVKEARDTQAETKQQFVTAMEQFKSVVHFQGGVLEKEYNTLNVTLKRSEAGADDVRKRIRSVEEVSQALFNEWRDEIKQYASDTLRAASQRQLDSTRAKYTQLIAAMKQAEAKLDPVLTPLRDQVLFMKHNLNARAISALDGELGAIQSNVDRLVRDMESAIAEADAFIASLQQVL